MFSFTGVNSCQLPCSTLLKETVTPTAQEAELAAQSSRLLAACLKQGDKARLRLADDQQKITLPASAVRLLIDLLAQMAQGNAVTDTQFAGASS